MSAQARHTGLMGRGRGGFTLIEILIVVAVIVILAGIVVAIGVGVSNSAKDRATRATLLKLDQAMGMFLGHNPEPNAATWLTALQAYPDSSSEIKDKVSFNGNVPQVLDGYGQPIQYIPTTASAKKVGFFESAGRDTIMGNADDIFSTGTSAGQP